MSPQRQLPAPLAYLGRSDQKDHIRLAAHGHTPFGRSRVRLEWEVRPLGAPLTGTPTGHGSWADTGTAGVALSELVAGLMGNTPYTWQVRLRYHPAVTPFQPAGRWTSLPIAGQRETRLRTADVTPPAVAVEQAADQADQANSAPARFRAVFSEPINSLQFTPSDVTVSGTAPGALVATISQVAPHDGTAFELAVRGMTGSGTVTAHITITSVAAGITLGGAGNGSFTSGDSYTIDRTPPEFAVAPAAGQANPAGALPLVFTVTASEPVSLSAIQALRMA